MLLTSRDGASVQLEISGYQFPEREADGPRDWDANWLNVRGIVVLADGTSWSFEDPCLTTWDAVELRGWLRDVAAGKVTPSLLDDNDEGRQMLVFLEPNVGFSVESRTGDQVRIRVHFSLESLPPWLQNAESGPELHEYYVPFDVLAADLVTAAEIWLRDAAGYPER